VSAVPGSSPEIAALWDAAYGAHPLAHIVYDTHSLRLLAANTAALARYGYSLEALLQLTRSELMMPGEAEALRQFLAGLPASALAEPQRVWRERQRGGHELLSDVRGMPVRWHGRPARLSVVMDAAPRARAQADAGRSRDLLQVAGRMAQLGGWYLDRANASVRLDDTVCLLHERPPGSVLTLEAAVAHYPGEAAGQIADAVRACLASGTPFDLELPFVGTRGTERWVRTAGEAARDAGGAIVAVQGAQQDVTGRKRAELALRESRRQLKDLLAAVPDLWIVVDAQGRYAEVSDPQHPSLSAPWGDKLGRPISVGVPEALAQQTRSLIARAHAAARTGSGGSSAPVSHTYELPMADGGSHVFEARYMPLPDGATLSLIRDMTQVRELASARQAQAVAEEAGRRQAAFMSRVSHELRTPLNAILGFGELLRGELARVPGNPGVYLGHVLRAGRHMLALVDDLLELQRIEQGPLQPVLADIDLDDLLAGSLQMLVPLANEAGVTLAPLMPGGLQVRSEARGLRQIVLNLGSNAIKYGGHGCTVAVAAAPDADHAVITVADNGAGMAPEQLQRLFQPFERLGQERRGIVGSGLGLVISRQLAQALGATLELASAPGRGTTATLRVPRITPTPP
jgi:PAS domain S-box-containing protein